MIFATEAERIAYAAGFADGRQAGNREMIDVLAPAVSTLPDLVPEHGSLTIAELAARIALVSPNTLWTLRPYDRTEAIALKVAADIAGRSETAVRDWGVRYGIGRSVVGSFEVSRPGLSMLLDGNGLALAALLSGRRDHPAVQPYMERCGIKVAA